MRAVFVKSLAAGAAAVAFAAAGPAVAQCSFESANSYTPVTAEVVNDALVAASTAEAPIVDIGQTAVVVTPRRPAPREIIVTPGVAQVAGIRPAPVEAPALYVIEDPS
jgi:hypothetical protein